MSNELKLKKEFLEFTSTDNQNTASLSVGSILLYAGQDMANISGNFLLCDGAEYSSSDDNFKYNALFNIIGNMYGGSSPNFKVPNLKGKLAIGAQDGLNTIVENSTNKVEGGVNSIGPNHIKHHHRIISNLVDGERSQGYHPSGGTGDTGVKRAEANVSSRFTTNNIGSNNQPESGQNNIYPKYCALNYIICYKV